MKTNKYLNLINTNDEQEQLYSSYTYDKSYIDYTVENKKVHYAQPFFHLTSSMRHPNRKLSVVSPKRGLTARCFLVRNRVFVK